MIVIDSIVLTESMLIIYYRMLKYNNHTLAN
jgi:hypothetical protein